jgi:hypothetical protein
MATNEIAFKDAYRAMHRQGVAFGQLCLQYEEDSDGKLVELLDELSIPKSLAYYWLAKACEEASREQPA